MIGRAGLHAGFTDSAPVMSGPFLSTGRTHMPALDPILYGLLPR